MEPPGDCLSSPASVTSERILEQIESDLVTCPVCVQKFSDPRLTPCGHTFCLDCLQQILDHNNNNNNNNNNIPAAGLNVKRSLNCPLCRKEFQVPEDGLSSVPKNFQLAQLVDLLEHKDVAGVHGCEQDKTRPGTHDGSAHEAKHFTFDASRVQSQLEADLELALQLATLEENFLPRSRANSVNILPQNNEGSSRQREIEEIDTMLAIRLTLDELDVDHGLQQQQQQQQQQLLLHESRPTNAAAAEAHPTYCRSPPSVSQRQSQTSQSAADARSRIQADGVCRPRTTPRVSACSVEMEPLRRDSTRHNSTVMGSYCGRQRIHRR